MRALFAKLPPGDLLEKVQLDMIYGLLQGKVRERLRRDEISSFDVLLHRARQIEESTDEFRHKSNDIAGTVRLRYTPAAALASSDALRPPRPSGSSTDSETKKQRPKCTFCHFYGHDRDSCRKLEKRDKSESIWDRFCHDNADKILDKSSGDVACDSYHQWQRDIEIIEELGAHFYRFSISWPRILPSGFPNRISKDGVRYYNNLIDGLLEKGIEPVVTIYHWDLPQNLQDLGGWANPLIADWFADYARVVYSLYGDRVKIWLTINEPIIVCDMPYNTGVFAPGILDTEVAPYLCSKIILMAHAKAWRIYDEEFKDKYHGRVSINNQLIWFEPIAPEHQGLADLTIENCAGRYSHAIYSKKGGWPPAIEQHFAELSAKEGLPRSKLPAFTQEEIELVRGTYDFYAMNHYTSRAVRPLQPEEEVLPWPMFDCPDLGAKAVKPEHWPVSDGIIWFWVYPEGIRLHLAWLKKTYGDLEIMIMENGYPSTPGLDDDYRVNYYRESLNQVLLAIKEDGVNVTRYTAWTLMDNFEWMAGYLTKFGLYEVDFSSPERTRTPRASAKFYAEIIKKHSLPSVRDEL